MRNDFSMTRLRGQAMVETIVVVFVTLLLLLGVIQFGLIYNAKTNLNYAAFEAARAGALNYADRRAIEFALARGLAPLYTSIDPAADKDANVEAVKAARDKVLEEIDGGEFVCIERLNPPVSAFGAGAHGIQVPAGSGQLFAGERLIPNDHLRYRSREPKQDLSIQDANLLKLRVTYCYPMIVPIVSTAIQRLTGTAPPTSANVVVGESVGGPTYGSVKPAGGFQKNCYAKGRFPIVAQSIMRMQTPIRNDIFPLSCS